MKHKRLLEALIAGTVLFGFCSCRTIDDEKIKDINEKEDRDYSLYKKRDFYRDERHAEIVYDGDKGVRYV